MKICTFNVLNLFLNLDKYRGEDLNTITEKEWQQLSPSFGNVPRNKSLFELINLAKAIEDIDADVFVLPECGGTESLKNFNKYFLSNKFRFILKEENSNRGIYVGYLVKKEYDYKIESYSNHKIIVNNKEKNLSRNLNLVTIIKDNKPVCKVLGVHLKSQRNDENSKDVDFMDVRQAELDAVLSIAKQNQDEVPLFVAGDFNFDLRDTTRQESIVLTNYDYVDIHQVKNSSEKERATFVYFQTMSSLKIQQQLDFILFDKKFEYLIDKDNSGTYYFKNEYGDSLGLPSSFQEKQQQPSDHCPLIVSFNVID